MARQPKGEVVPKTTFPPLPSEQLKFLRKRLNALTQQRQDFKTLRKLLLSIDGIELVVPDGREHDLMRLLTEGFVFGGPVTLKKMADHQCHLNTAKLVLKDEAMVGFCSGYGLSEDGLWRQHSWAMHRTKGIIETTVPRLVYFGVVATGYFAQLIAKEFQAS
jgi:hypothetical protein